MAHKLITIKQINYLTDVLTKKHKLDKLRLSVYHISAAIGLYYEVIVIQEQQYAYLFVVSFNYSCN